MSQIATSLRAEARLLTIAGLILIAIGFPITLALAIIALTPGGMSPIIPPAVGGPFLVLGYLACHHASSRLAKAKRLEALLGFDNARGRRMGEAQVRAPETREAHHARDAAPAL